jgi:hypothetical protein
MGNLLKVSTRKVDYGIIRTLEHEMLAYNNEKTCELRELAHVSSYPSPAYDHSHYHLIPPTFNSEHNDAGPTTYYFGISLVWSRAMSHTSLDHSHACPWYISVLVQG